RHAGTDGIDVDVVGAQLLRRRLGEADDGALAGGVGGIGGADVALAGDRGDVDDAPALPRNHRARDGLQAEEHPLRVHTMDAVPVGFGDIHDMGAPRHAGVVDEDVDAPVLGHGAVDHALDVGDAAHV